MTWGRRGVLLAGVLAVTVAALPAAAAEPDWPYDPPRPAPAFSLPDLDGRQVTLADLRGKVTLVFFWATW